jgi:hypothetical protein
MKLKSFKGGWAYAFQAGRKEWFRSCEVLEKLSIGDRALLLFPANLAYGEGGAGNGFEFHPNTPWFFDITIMENQIII